MEIKINNIYLGDAYEMIKQIPDHSVDLIYTDIPYLINGGGGSGKNPSGLCQRITNKNAELGVKNSIESLKKREQDLLEKMHNAKTKEEYEKYHCMHGNILNKISLETANIADGIDYKILDEFVRVCRDIYIYIWCSKEQIYDLMQFFVGKHHCLFNLLVWCKTNCVPATNNTWLPNIEHCLVFKSKNAKKYNNGYDLKSKWYISSTNKFDKDQYTHPTIKPLELVERHLKHSCKKGDVVLDPFLGSGTTALACKHLGLNYIGFEINEKYYNIASKRLKGENQKGELNLFDLDYEENV